MATTPTTQAQAASSEITTTPPSTPVIYVPVNWDTLGDSWCDIKFKSGCSSTGSISHINHTVNPEILEKLLQEAQRESIAQPPLLPNDYSTQQQQQQQQHKTEVTKSINKPSLSASAQSALYYSQFSFNSTDNIDDFITDNNLLTDSISNLNSQTSTPPLKSTTFTTHTSQTMPSTPATLSLSMSCATKNKCYNCDTHKKQLSIMLEKQRQQQDEIDKLKRKLINDYEASKTDPDPLLISTSSSSSVLSSSSDSSHDNNNATPLMHPLHLRDSKKTAAALAAAIRKQNSGIIGTMDNSSSPPTTTTLKNDDWSKFWTSRPQTKPPKEWSIIKQHNNNDSNDSKATSVGHLNLNMNAELFIDKTKKIFFNNNNNNNRESIGKLIFTHVASFIVGATLMFLVFRRHLNSPLTALSAASSSSSTVTPIYF